MNKQVVLDVILKKKKIHKKNQTSKMYKIVSQIYHFNLDQWSLQSKNLNDKGIKEKGQTPTM